MEQNVIDRLKVLFPKEEPEIILEAMLSYLEGNKAVVQLMALPMEKYIKSAKAQRNGKL